MMKLRTALAAISLLPAAVFSIAATDTSACTTLDAGAETTPDDDVIACEDAAYLAGCDAAVGGKVYHQVVHGSVPLADAAPAASFTEGAGCGTYEEPGFRGGTMENPFYDLSVRGYLLGGNPGSITVELHSIYAGAQRATGEPVELNVRLTVDSVSPFGSETVELVNGETSHTPTNVTVPVTPVVSSTGVSEKLEFTVVGLYEAFPELFEMGTGPDFRDVVLSVSFPEVLHTAVWGASEIPASISFNVEPRGTLVEAGTGRILGEADTEG